MKTNPELNKELEELKEEVAQEVKDIEARARIEALKEQVRAKRKNSNLVMQALKNTEPGEYEENDHSPAVLKINMDEIDEEKYNQEIASFYNKDPEELTESDIATYTKEYFIAMGEIMRDEIAKAISAGVRNLSKLYANISLDDFFKDPFKPYHVEAIDHIEASTGERVTVEESKAFFDSLDWDKEAKEHKEATGEILEDLPMAYAIGVVLHKYYPVKEVPTAVFKYPDKTTLTTDKVTREAFSNTLTGNKPVSLAMEKKDLKKITTRARISFDRELNQALAEKGLEEIDGIVHRAIMTNYDTGNQAMTIASIYRVITGDKKGRPSKNWIETIQNSIDKQMSAVLFLDYSEETEYYKNLVKKTSVTNELFLKAEILSMEVNGNLVDSVLLVKRPTALWEYGKQKGQISNLDMKYLNTPGNNTEAIVIIKEYLLSRIIQIKRQGHKLSNNIRLDTVYDQVPDFNNVKSRNALLNKRRKHTERIIDMLEYWKKEGLIHEYSINVKDGLDHSITIVPEEPEPKDKERPAS